MHGIYPQSKTQSAHMYFDTEMLAIDRWNLTGPQIALKLFCYLLICRFMVAPALHYLNALMRDAENSTWRD